MSLNEKQFWNRYKRHILLDNIGESGQKLLADSKVLIVGLGGLGCPIAMYLAASGIGTLGLCDLDNIDESNLQRQILYQEEDIGSPKVIKAKERLEKYNSKLNFELYPSGMNSDFSIETIKTFDVLLDATDNFETRYLLNALSHNSGVPLVYGAIHKFEGQVSVFNSQSGPCYNCIYPEEANENNIPDCAQTGVLGILPGIIGMFQAIEAIKILLPERLGIPLTGRLLIYDAINQETKKIKLKKNKFCQVCSSDSKISIKSRVKQDSCSSNLSLKTVTAKDLSLILQSGEDIKLIDVRESIEHINERIPGSIHLSLEKFFSLTEFLEENPEFIKEEDKIILYCQSGARSKKAGYKLLESGFKNVSNLVGGFLAWQLIN